MEDNLQQTETQHEPNTHVVLFHLQLFYSVSGAKIEAEDLKLKKELCLFMIHFPSAALLYIKDGLCVFVLQPTGRHYRETSDQRPAQTQAICSLAAVNRVHLVKQVF